MAAVSTVVAAVTALREPGNHSREGSADSSRGPRLAERRPLSAAERKALRQLISQTVRERLALEQSAARTCPYCGDPLPDDGRRDRKYCSHLCATKAATLRHKERKAAAA